MDPGYHGPLICPVFNLSTRPYKLEYGKRLFTIDFVKTTSFVPGKSRPLDDLGGRDTGSIGALDKLKTESAIKERLKKMEKDVDIIKSETRAFHIGIMMAISILVMVLGILITFQIFTGRIDWEIVNLDSLRLDLSVAAIFIAGVALIVGLISLFKRL